jgi:hypothetical protein
MTTISPTQKELHLSIDGCPVTAVCPNRDTSEVFNHIRSLLISSFAASRNDILAHSGFSPHNIHKSDSA